MNRLFDTAAPSVIDEKMLRKAVQEQGPQGQAGRLAKEEGIQYNEVIQLCLELRNILKIGHLWEFTSLTKLQLNNNIIEKIQGLEKLTNLVWLDLSFNNIEVIEGLDSLVKLQNLSLFNNRISVIENMDALGNLQIVSVGNNLISQLDNVIYLRKFKELHTLNLAGNPICQEENYKIFVAAYLSDLVYLDYRLLDEQTREKACVEYQYALEEMRLNELQEQKEIEAQKITEQELQLHKDAFVELLNGPHLFDSMFADDADAPKLACLPGVTTLLESYKTQLVALCMQMFEAGLTQHARRQNEVESFFSCSREAEADNQQRAAQIAADFERSRRQVMAEMQKATDTKLLEAQASKYSDEISQLCDTLMTLELQLVDQLEDVIKDFERNISDLVGGFTEYVQGIFAQCRDLENHHHEKLLEIAVATLDRVAKNELEEDLPDDVRMLFVDKDTLINAVSASHDTHLLKIDNREDELMMRINSWMSALIKSIQDEEVKRNRKRISEIHNYVDFVKDQLEEILLEEHQ
ncbi:dynein regulatory complex subunit 3 isoform X1 [Pygocentrus nattereri]|uniref:Dynein regulatory complex subunit 3 n=1 Tax=Pygocentrus nattereri TaxID=42514 RepID=A0A3B4CJZ4_PYGNA|nr:dynein regulatory complex subunit 3 isoform X1 [Pygocentrus nattereri]XP_037400842.1 dynein regulatory complex subunit 3 isoform X1 [Pygocentrus nattereri]